MITDRRMQMSAEYIYKDRKVGIYKPAFIINDKVILEVKMVSVTTKAMENQVIMSGDKV